MESKVECCDVGEVQITVEMARLADRTMIEKSRVAFPAGICCQADARGRRSAGRCLRSGLPRFCVFRPGNALDAPGDAKELERQASNCSGDAASTIKIGRAHV